MEWLKVSESKGFMMNRCPVGHTVGHLQRRVELARRDGGEQAVRNLLDAENVRCTRCRTHILTSASDEPWEAYRGSVRHLRDIDRILKEKGLKHRQDGKVPPLERNADLHQKVLLSCERCRFPATVLNMPDPQFAIPPCNFCSHRFLVREAHPSVPLWADGRT